MKESKWKTQITSNVQRSVAVLQALADYMRYEGCSCCRNQMKQDEAKAKLAGLLGVPMYDDGSGYDFNQFASDPVEIEICECGHRLEYHPASRDSYCIMGHCGCRGFVAVRASKSNTRPDVTGPLVQGRIYGE